MIFGKTYKEEAEITDRWWKQYIQPHSWFAWYPVRLQDGRRAWLEYVVRKWMPGEYGHDFPIYYLKKESSNDKA